MAREEGRHAELASRHSEVELTKGDLDLVVGGSGDPGDGEPDEMTKATPVLF
jgi:hypothetical protein